MTLNDRIQFVNLLYKIQNELLKEAEEQEKEIDETLDEALRVLICKFD